MKIYQIYNEQRSRVGGEFAVVDATMRVLTENGHEPRLVMKSSRVLETSAWKRINAFWGGVYNVHAYRDMRDLLKKDRPDVVHVHSVYPMFSPSILVACKHEGVPVVKTVHSNNLTCPTWFHIYKGKVCEDCVGGHEYRCVLKNCRDNILESAAYALRSGVARRFRLFHDNVDILIVLSEFSKQKLVEAGFRKDQIIVVPNPTHVPDAAATPSTGKYVAFAGRMSSEKGVATLLEAAAQLPEIPFKVAGVGPILAEMQARATPNVEFAGKLGPEEMRNFYQQARLLATPSIWFEPFGLVVVEAMALGLPVTASRIGALPYIVDEGRTGLLFEPGNAGDLAKQIRQLWDHPELCDQMGKAGRQKVLREYTEDAYFHNLMDVYRTAILKSRGSVASSPPLVHISNAVLPASEASGQ